MMHDLRRRSIEVVCEAWDADNTTREEATRHAIRYPADCTEGQSFTAEILGWATDVARDLAKERWPRLDYPETLTIHVAVTPEAMQTLIWAIVVRVEERPHFVPSIAKSLSTEVSR